MKKITYRSTDVQKITAAQVLSRIEGPTIVFAHDVAKKRVLLAITAGDGTVAHLVHFKMPWQLSAVFALAKEGPHWVQEYTSRERICLVVKRLSCVTGKSIFRARSDGPSSAVSSAEDRENARVCERGWRSRSTAPPIELHSARGRSIGSRDQTLVLSGRESHTRQEIEGVSQGTLESTHRD
jgi:hypothetical protein